MLSEMVHQEILCAIFDLSFSLPRISKSRVEMSPRANLIRFDGLVFAKSCVGMGSENFSKVKKLRFGHQDTRKNLPSSQKRGESNFLAKFERVFSAAEVSKLETVKLASGREFSVEGFGRADVVFVAWKEAKEGEDFKALALKSLKLTAFEAKLKDWRKGLVQASRYKHFANRSILVLPTETAMVAKEYVQTFRELQIGLWEFDTQNQRIVRHTTPRARKAKNSKAREKAIHLLQKKLKFG